jgi:hypothetical protein
MFSSSRKFFSTYVDAFDPRPRVRGVSSRRLSGRSIHHTYIIYLFDENCNTFLEVNEKFTYSTPKRGTPLAAGYPMDMVR